MLSFSLTAAKNGRNLMTRSGKDARYVTVLSDERIPARLIVEVEQMVYCGEGEPMQKEWVMENYYLNGRHETVHPSPFDLFVNEIL